MTSPEPLLQIQNNFTELFLWIPSTKIAQMVTLHWTKGLPELQIRNTFKLSKSKGSLVYRYIINKENDKGLNEFEFCNCFKLELPAIEHNKLWTFQTLSLLPGEQLLSIGLLVLFLNQIICCGYSKDQSQWDSSFEHPKHLLSTQNIC